MKSYSRTHLSDHDLLESHAARRGAERGATADDLADISEIDARKLYLPAAFPSMHSYCVQARGYSEDEASKRIQAARVARAFPVIFEMIADGRLNLTGLCILAPYLVSGVADEILTAATHKTNREIRELLARRCPRSEMLPMVAGEHAAQHVEGHRSGVGQHAAQHVALAPNVDPQHAAQHVEARPRIDPLSSESFGLSFSIGRETHDNLRYALALASHQVRPGDVAEAFDRALKAWIRELEKTRFSATERPRRGERRVRELGRHLSADVKRTVWERDGGRCTFESEAGHRCPATELLQFDHVMPFARGGTGAAANIRLRCRAHNQFEAERAFGREFMEQKRAAAVKTHGRAAARNGGSQAPAPVSGGGVAAPGDGRKLEYDIFTCLRQLGVRPEEARAQPRPVQRGKVRPWKKACVRRCAC